MYQARTIVGAAVIAVAMSVGAAFSQSAYTGDMMDMSEMRGDLIRARDITGGEIYTVNEAYDEASWTAGNRYDGIGDGWNQIGEIEDIVLSKDGKMIGVVGEIGGFLDIADKHVMIPVEDVRLVAVDDKTYALVTRYSEEALENLPGVDEGFWN